MNQYFESLTLVPHWVWVSFSAVLGAIVGSFLNVVIHRLPRGEDIVKTPSHCPHCGQNIPFYRNIPVVTWLLQGGKAACCGEKLTPRYMLVELLTATLTAYEFHLFGPTTAFLHGWIFTLLLICLIFIDWEHMRLPNVLTLPGLVTGLLFSMFGTGPSPVDALIGVAVGAGGFYTTMLLYRLARGVEGMGMGDVKLMGMIGAFLGWKLTLLVVILGSLLGLVYGIIVMVRRRETTRMAIPYGVFLGLAGIVVLLWGQPLLDWYLGFYIT